MSIKGSPTSAAAAGTTGVCGGSRLVWVDVLRGISMLAILLFHTEMYYAGRDVIPYNIYVQNVLAVFFFVSGYLFCRPGSRVSVRRNVRTVARSLLLPYVVFTVPICLIKPFVHGEAFCAADILEAELTGHASWFVAALITAQLLFALMHRLCRGNILTMAVPVACAQVLSWLTGNGHGCAAFYEADLWHVNEALPALLFMYAGLVYRYEETAVNSAVGRVVCVTAAVALCGLKWWECSRGLDMVMGPLIVSSYPLFLADCMLGILLLTAAVRRCVGQGGRDGGGAGGVSVRIKKIPHIRRYVEFVGANSLYFYFFCGASPVVVSKLFAMLWPYSGCYVPVLPVYGLVCGVCSAAVWMVVWLRKRYTLLS